MSEQKNQFGNGAGRSSEGSGNGASGVGKFRFNSDNIMNAHFGEVGNKISANFKKTILIRAYETEVIEGETEIELKQNLDGMDRTLVNCLLQAQIELEVYMSLYIKGRISKEEYEQRKSGIEYTVNMMAYQYEKLTGRNAGVYLDMLNKDVEVK